MTPTRALKATAIIMAAGVMTGALEAGETNSRIRTKPKEAATPRAAPTGTTAYNGTDIGTPKAAHTAECP